MTVASPFGSELDERPGAAVETLDRRRAGSVRDAVTYLGLQRERDRSGPILARPGLFERFMVVFTTFVFVHGTPDAWFRARSEAVAEGNAIATAMQLLLVTLALVRVIGSIDHWIRIMQAELAVYLYAGLALASIIWSADPGFSLQRSGLFLSTTVFASYLVMRFSLHEILKLLAQMVVISSFVNLGFVFAFGAYAADSGGNLTGVFSQKNALGFVTVIGLPLLIVAGMTNRRWRLVFFGAIPVQVFLLLGSQSKTMLIATVVPTTLMAVYHLFRSRKTLRGAVILSMAGSSAFAIMFSTANIAVLAAWLDKDVTLTGRIPMWQTLLPIAMERPVLGYGYAAAFGGYFSPVHELWIQSRWEPQHAHNALLQIMLNLGLVGVALFLMLYVRGVGRAIKLVAIVPGGVGLWPLTFLTTTLMVSLTESGMSSNTMGWVMLVVAVLSTSLHLRHRSELGLSNDLRAATRANQLKQAIR